MQPWTPTKAFPHPLSCLSYQQGWSSENYISYQVTTATHCIVLVVCIGGYESDFNMHYASSPLMYCIRRLSTVLLCRWWTACSG